MIEMITIAKTIKSSIVSPTTIVLAPSRKNQGQLEVIKSILPCGKRIYLRPNQTILLVTLFSYVFAECFWNFGIASGSSIGQMQFQ
jgi:hypothetical protein